MSLHFLFWVSILGINNIAASCWDLPSEKLLQELPPENCHLEPCLSAPALPMERLGTREGVQLAQVVDSSGGAVLDWWSQQGVFGLCKANTNLLSLLWCVYYWWKSNIWRCQFLSWLFTLHPSVDWGVCKSSDSLNESVAAACCKFVTQKVIFLHCFILREQSEFSLSNFYR